MGKGPIYIAGVSYSGKTQMRLMLSAHPEILITRRTYLWKRFYNRFGDLGKAGNFGRCLAALVKSKHIQALEPDPERIHREFWQGEPTYSRLFALVHKHNAERHGKTRWGDQSGALENDADLIIPAEPNAVILHMVRHPCDRVEESLSSAGLHKGMVGWETGRWQRSSQLAERNLKKYPHHYKVVHCEQLFAYPERVLREVCLFIGEMFHPEMLSVPGLAEMGVDVPEKPVKREQATDPGSAFAHPRLTPAERSFVQSRARDEMSFLGYPSRSQNLSLTNRLAYALLDYPLNLAGSLLWETWGRKVQLKTKIFSFRS